MNSRHRDREQPCGLATIALVTAWLGTLEAAPAPGSMAPSFGDPPIPRAASAIVLATHAPARVKLGAQEVRRYVWLRTGALLPIAATGSGIAPKVG